MADLYTLFDNLRPDQAQAAAAQFQQVFVEAGGVIVEEGESNDSMLLIEGGEVAVFAGGFEVARMSEGAMIGEIGLFNHALRTATVTAVTPVALQVLTRAGLDTLRNQGNPMAFRLERRALVQLMGRSRQLVDDMGRVVDAAPHLVMDVPSGMIRPSRMPVSSAECVQLLSGAPAFHGVDPATMERIGKAFSPVGLPVGPVAWAGQEVGPLLFIARGSVAAYAPVDDRCVEVASLQAGDLFDVASQVDRRPRPTHFAVTEDALLLELDSRSTQHAIYLDDHLGSALRVAMIRALADRVNQLNSVYSLARLLAPPSEEPDMEAMLPVAPEQSDPMPL